MKPNKIPVPTESIEQQHLFAWAAFMEGRYPEIALMYHIPNEGKRSKATGGRLRAEGLKKGVPDICLPVPREQYHGLYIEMKRTKHSTITDDQKWWLAALRSQGYLTMQCKGMEQAKNAIELYLALEKPATVGEVPNYNAFMQKQIKIAGM